MCGIAGFQGRWDPALAQRMMDRLAHRGPDGQGTHSAAEAASGVATALAHRRLAIIDVSSDGAQPMSVRCPECCSDGLDDLALVFNGEIYNFPELRSELERAGHRFHSHSDSEVLLHLYAVHGPAMLDRLNGIFAFAIRDGRARGRPAGVEPGDLFIARDPLGVKPLYYTALDRGTLFASELKALLVCADVPRRLDPIAVHEYLAYLWVPGDRTMLAGVRRLEPGCALVVRAGRIARQWRYYELPYDGTREARPRAELVDEVREAVAAAVRRQLLSDVPVGAFLSGGLDSSSVVAMMGRAAPGERHQCYTISLPDGTDGFADDEPYARRVAAHLGVPLESVVVESSVIERLAEMIYLLDEPQADPAPLNALLIAERARSQGLKVLLSGAGGDDIFSGYRRHVAVRYGPYWNRLPRPLRRGIGRVGRAVAGGALPIGGQQGIVLRRLAKLMSSVDQEGDRQAIAQFFWSTESVRRGLYSDDLRAETEGVDVAAPLLASLARIPAEHDALNRMLFIDTKHFLADHNLNYTDRMGMAAGVEVRVPFLDLDLVRLAARIPPGWKQEGRVGKAILKSAMEPILPHDVIYRPKTGFGAPIRRWLRGELRGVVADLLSPDAVRRRGLFRPDAVQRLVDWDRAGRVDGSYTILALMCLELWCRIFLDAAEVTKPARLPLASAGAAGA